MITAFIVVRFVWPAVTAADQARMTTNGAMDVTAQTHKLLAPFYGKWNAEKLTGYPVAEQQPDAVVGKRVHEDRT